jgi:hypothetical protein
MAEHNLHIVSFDIPYPPNYGGVIDVFHKIRALHAAGVKIHLHCFRYNREPAPELEKYCASVRYYRRKTHLLAAMKMTPYIVYSRRSKELLDNLVKEPWPILFEGLHSCYYLDHRSLRGRFRIYRESNIEHRYYYHLFKAENRLFHKMYFFFSSMKLKWYEQVLGSSSLILTVSQEDNEYLSHEFPEVRVEYLPSFHPDDDLHILPGTGDYILYHGNLSVAENRKAAEYLVHTLGGRSRFPLVIAGLNPPPSLVNLAERSRNVRLVSNPGEAEMTELIRNAQVNLLVTFQATGLKLKLLNALFNGRHCLVNPEMVVGTELGGLCTLAAPGEELVRKLDDLLDAPFTEAMIATRREKLGQWHSNLGNCKKLLDFLPL